MKNSSEPIRVAQIIGKMWAGGVETVIFNYYRNIDRNRIQFDFFYEEDSTVEPPKELIEMGARFYKLPPYQNIRHYIPELRNILRKNKYKIIHSHLNTISVFPLFAAYCENIPIRIAHNHSVPGGNEWKRNTLKYILRCFAKVFPTDYFACSEKAGRWLFGDKLYDSGRVHVIRNAIDFEKFKNNSNKSQLIERYKLDGKFVVGHIGRFTYAKNHMFLLSIFKEILKIKSEAILLLVGDGELHDQIVAKTQSLGLSNNVIFVGQTLTPNIYYSIMDVIIMPSHFEGLPLTTIEAQVSGTPIVLSDVITKETNISINGFKYMSLNDSPKEWALAGVAIANHRVELLPINENYDIKKAAPLLAQWYEERVKKLER